jgi:DNA-binding IclR family transcriptional regulator
MRTSGRSAAELAATIALSEKRALPILRGLERDGLAEQTLGGWRLTVEAERRYGWALRAFQGWLDELREDAA